MTTALGRKHRRHVFQAVCVASSLEDGRIVGDRTFDVSFSGVRIGAVDAARVGEKVELALEIPGSRLWMTARGRIERVIGGHREGDEGPAFGVRLDEMNGFDRMMLTMIASGMPETTSTRGGQRDYAKTVERIRST